MKSKKVEHIAGAIVAACLCTARAATTNTWDADLVAPGAQDGAGVWTSSLSGTNWWNNAAANTNWSNVTPPDLTVIGAGSGAAGTVTLGEAITVGHLRFNAAGSGSYTLDGNGNPLSFGFNYPLLWVSAGVSVTNLANGDNAARDLNISGGGTIVFAGTNIFHSVDVMDASIAWYGITGGVAGSTITIPAGASFKTTGYPPVWQYSTFGIRLRDAVTLNVSGSLTTSSRLGGHSGEDYFTININPGAVVTNTGDTLLGWNSPATLNVNGGTMVAGGGVFHQDNNAGYLNLNGGTLETPHVWVSSAADAAFYVAFNGGTLKAQSDALLEENSDKSCMSTYQVKAGGVVIDSNGKNPEAVLPFIKKGSGGLVKQGSGTLTFSGGSYTGATSVAAGTLNLNFNRRAAWAARDAVGEFYDRASRLVLNGGNFVVTGRAAVPAVTRNFLIGGAAVNNRCARSGSTNSLVAGMPVSGLHIPTNTYVAYIKDSAKLTLSQAATNGAAATVPLTFGGVTNTTWQTIDTIELQQSSTLTVNANGGPGTTLSVGAITGVGGLTKEGNGTLALFGTNTYGGATLIKGGTVKLTAPVTVTNASFEIHTPLTEHPPYGFFDTPANAFWSFSSAGIAALGSTWVSSNAVIDGADAAFIQANATSGTMSTTLVLPADGLYVISFMAGKRPNMPACALSVEVDGSPRFGFAAAEFGEAGGMFTGTAMLTGGTHTLTFRGPYTGVDTAIWLDRVTVTTLESGSVAGAMPTGTVVTVTSGAVLDLGGQPQALAGVRGGGTVTNGALTVSGTVAPGDAHVIGTLTLATDTTLSGTVLIDTSVGGSNDLLRVQGPLNLNAASLQIQDLGQLKHNTSYVVATCTPGGLSGSFLTSNLEAKLWHVVYDNVKGEVRLEFVRGILISVR